MKISKKTWLEYTQKMSAVNKKATDKVKEWIEKYPNFDFEDPQHISALVEYSYAISTKYGEAAASLACEMYDSVAEASGLLLDPAVPAATPVYKEVEGTVKGVTSVTHDAEAIAATTGKFVKRTGADTTIQNGLRDGAEFAWIPDGETCAFCLELASRGWQSASKDLVKRGHVEHIHPNCDCQFAIRFNPRTTYSGYDPEKYKKMYYDAPLEEGQKITAKNRLNALRRQIYAKNKDEINEQKRSAYEKREELNSSKAEEANVN